MERNLSLIKTDFLQTEKRVFPRFPFGFLIFKDHITNERPKRMLFEVKDISLTGMQISYKDETHQYLPGMTVFGDLHWRELAIDIKASVEWVEGPKIGLSFDSSISFEEKMGNFLSYDNIVSHIKPLHKEKLDFSLPNNLMYWLKADGVLEIFVWGHPLSGILKFDVLLMDHFIEWEEGVGMRTGKIMTQRDLETPLTFEDEFIFQIDEFIDPSKIEMALGVTRKINNDILPLEAKEFLIYKLGG